MDLITNKKGDTNFLILNFDDDINTNILLLVSSI